MAIALLRDPLPDPLPPSSGRFRRLRHLAAWAVTAVAVEMLSAQEQANRRVRRGSVQAVVREAYQATVAEQDDYRRRPAAFAQAWREHLAVLLGSERIELYGWGEITVASADVELAWSLLEAASSARRHTIESARASPSKLIPMGSPPTSVFEFAVVGRAGGQLGDVKYGVCPACRVGLLYNIGFAPDWQFSGLGRLALRELETRHPMLTWYTSGQHSWARGFYDRYRAESASPWTSMYQPCPHL